MAHISLRIPDELLAALDDESDNHDVSRSQHIRNTLETRNEHTVAHAEYEQQIAELEQEVERLKREKRMILEQRDEHQELVRYAQEDREVAQREQEHREMRRNAPVWRRAKWWVFGHSDDEPDDTEA